MGNMSTIKNGTTCSEFRRRCEDKKTLTSKGSLYIGTGEIEDGVCKTAELSPPSERMALGYDPSATGNNVSWVSDTAAYIEITNEDYFFLLRTNKIDKNAIYVIFEEE